MASIVESKGWGGNLRPIPHLLLRLGAGNRYELRCTDEPYKNPPSTGGFLYGYFTFLVGVIYFEHKAPLRVLYRKQAKT